MKKSIFTLGVLILGILCLSACGNKKDFNMSFEEALELASHSSIQDVMANADNAEQSLNIAGTYDKDDTKVDAKLISKSKQNLKDIQSESNISVDLKIQGEENNLNLKGDLDIKFVPSALYLSLNSLDIEGDESTESMAGLASSYLNQWFSIPLDETLNLNSFNMKDQLAINSKIKEIINNEGFQVYSGKFTDYNGYNAWKISIDDEKLIKILKDYYNSELAESDITEDIENIEEVVNEENIAEETNEEETTDEEAVIEENITEEITNEEVNENGTNDEEINNEYAADLEDYDVKIENFEGYLVIIGKDKVALAIENMDIVENEVATNLNGIFSEKDILLNVYSEGEEVITLSAKRKGSHFNINLNLTGLCSVEGSVAPKISSSNVDISFDLSLIIKSDEENTIIPLKGSWSYTPISEYKVEIPSESQDLSEMLGGMLGGLYGGGDAMNYDDYYADYDLNAEDLYNEELTDNTEEEPIINETENNDEINAE